MVTHSEVVQLAARVKRLAYAVSAAFILGLISVAVAALGNALGGNVLSFMLALALIGTLTVLVLHVVMQGASRTQAAPVKSDITAPAVRDRLAA